MLTEEQALAPDDPRRIAMEARLRRLEQWAERPRWIGPHKADMALGEHKALGLDEPARIAHAERFAETAAERAALAEEADRQLVQEKRARAGGAVERKDVARG